MTFDIPYLCWFTKKKKNVNAATATRTRRR